MWKKIGRAAAVAAACLSLASGAEAQGRPECLRTITRATIVPCALEASLDVRAERAGVDALEGRRVASGALLPANPVLALSGGTRSSASESATNWYATLSQEIEVAGQRSSRARAADAALAAQRERLLLGKRDAAALAWSAFFEALAAREQLRLADRLLATSERMAVVARARADEGVAATLDADLADAATLRLLKSKLAAERSVATANARLALLVLGREPSAGLAVEGVLNPLPGLDARAETADVSRRPEVRATEAEERASSYRAEALRRSRVPNPTVSAFAQNDGFSERVFGLGVAIPIPLPPPVGRTYAGEIAEADALARQASIERSRVERGLRLELAEAHAAYTAHRLALEAMTPERLARAAESLRELEVEIEAGRVGVREALVAQQTLIELLQTEIAARRALCLASVRLARALGLPLEEGLR